jgi:hypothetical protein
MEQFLAAYSNNYNIYDNRMLDITVNKYKAYANYNPPILKVQIITNVVENTSYPILEITYKLLISNDIIIANTKWRYQYNYTTNVWNTNKFGFLISSKLIETTTESTAVTQYPSTGGHLSN